LWEQNFCIKSPLALGYTRGELDGATEYSPNDQPIHLPGHFSALVPSEPISINSNREEEDVTYLPLMSCDKKLIPIHFITQAEVTNDFTPTWDMTKSPFSLFQAGPRREDNAKLVGCLFHRRRLDGELKEELTSEIERFRFRSHAKSITKDLCWWRKCWKNG
jgi:hypothetical protein